MGSKINKFGTNEKSDLAMARMLKGVKIIYTFLNIRI